MTIDQLRKCLANVPGEHTVHIFIAGQEETAMAVTLHSGAVCIGYGDADEYPCDAILHEE